MAWRGGSGQQGSWAAAAGSSVAVWEGTDCPPTPQPPAHAQLVKISVPEGAAAKGGKVELDGIVHWMPHRPW